VSDIVDRILQAAREAPRLPVPARSGDEDALQGAARRIRDLAPDAEELAEAESRLLQSAGPVLLGPVLSVKLARSMAAVSALPAATTLWVLFAMFKETGRLRSPDRHPHGEDLLRNKIRQLERLFAGCGAQWKLVAVDDGCPDGSGRLALEILRRSFPGHIEAGRAAVLFLEEAVAARAPEAAGIEDAGASKKGGSLLFGLRKILSLAGEGDVVVYTDADLSTHIGQAGLLAGPLARDEADVMAGSRREWNSVQVKSRSRSSRGRLFIHLWKRLLPVMPGIIDSQAAFKAFRADRAGPVLADAGVTGFAVDLELLLLAHLKGLRVDTAGICWIDSEAESSTAGQDVHLAMLRTAAALRRRHLPPGTPGEEIALRVESLDQEKWDEMVRRPPAAVLEAPLEKLGDPGLM